MTESLINRMKDTTEAVVEKVEDVLMNSILGGDQLMPGSKMDTGKAMAFQMPQETYGSENLELLHWKDEYFKSQEEIKRLQQRLSLLSHEVASERRGREPTQEWTMEASFEWLSEQPFRFLGEETRGERREREKTRGERRGSEETKGERRGSEETRGERRGSEETRRERERERESEKESELRFESFQFFEEQDTFEYRSEQRLDRELKSEREALEPQSFQFIEEREEEAQRGQYEFKEQPFGLYRRRERGKEESKEEEEELELQPQPFRFEQVSAPQKQQLYREEPLEKRREKFGFSETLDVPKDFKPFEFMPGQASKLETGKAAEVQTV